MNRRQFFKNIGAASLASSLPTSFNLFAQQADYAGKFLITVQAEGGWDVTSLCDPKTNTPGEPDINNWANTGEIQTAGNISYAPFADNARFFQKYYRDMLVINGVDCQTNSHETGVLHNWSGRISEGHPSVTALFAAAQAPDLPINYINNGGFAATSGLTRYTRLENIWDVNNVIYPNSTNWDIRGNWLHPNDWARISEFRNERFNAMSQKGNETGLQSVNRSNYKASLENASILKDFSNQIASAGDPPEDEMMGNQFSSLRRQAMIALLAMKSGVCVSADLTMGGYDTHDDHDTQHNVLFSMLLNGVDYLWEYAESLGLADRLVVVIGSDFSRTNFYNDNNGKDHWPIGSFIVMEKNQSYTNRVVGRTDELHFALPIDPSSHVTDTNAGFLIHPVAVMNELRTHLGINEFAIANSFNLSPDTHFGFFS